MPRIKSSPKKCIKSNLQPQPNSWVFLLKGTSFMLKVFLVCEFFVYMVETEEFPLANENTRLCFV